MISKWSEKNRTSEDKAKEHLPMNCWLEKEISFVEFLEEWER